MWTGLVLLVFVCGALHLLGLMVLTGLYSLLLITIFLIVVMPLTGLLMVSGVWDWFISEREKRRKRKP